LQENATVIVNTTKSADEIRDMLQLHSGTIYTIDADAISAKTHSRLNMPMMAMLSHVLKFPEEHVKESIEQTWPKVAAINIAAYDAAVSESVSKTFAADGKYNTVPPAGVLSPIGYKNMIDGGAIDGLTQSTIVKNNSNVRFNEPPKFDVEACINCAKCLTVCADPGAIVWKDAKMAGVDLSYCKGCMRCVAVCPETKKGRALIDPEKVEVN
jgi:pyruvate ferredoxin oxidoreductase gamma subunit